MSYDSAARPSSYAFGSSELLQAIAREMGHYTPPPVNSFVRSLQGMKERAETERATLLQNREHVETNIKTLTDERDRIAAYLEGVSYISPVADVGEALVRRAAVEFLLERAPQLGGVRQVSVVDAVSADAARLRAWHDRLVVERQRLESELSEGASSYQLRLDLEAVKSALGDASANLSQAARAGLIDREFVV